MRAWVDGRLLDDVSEPAVRVTDHGFMVGDAVFEAAKVVHNRPFALTRHLARLATSARGLGLPEPDLAAVRGAIAELLEAEPMARGRLRITYTAGDAPLGSGRGPGPGTLVVIAAPLQEAPRAASVVTLPWPRNERSAAAGLKTTSYAENVVALTYARDRGAHEAIYANTRGLLCEGTGSNVFYVVDGRVRTPSLASGCLAGVTRALLLEWYAVEEVDEPIEVLARAEEVFLSSTTRDVQPVARCDDRELPAPGPVTSAVMAVWREREALDVDP